MTDTDHQNELKAVKEKAYGILEDEGVLSALLTILQSNQGDDDLLAEFSSPIAKIIPNESIQAGHDETYWRHHAYLVDGETIQISYFEKTPWRPFDDGDEFTEHQAYLYVLQNFEQQLFSKGSATRTHKGWGWEDWEFSKYGAQWLEIVKLNKVWMAAVKEIASELKRVKKLKDEALHRADELRAERAKSNFDLGDFE